MRALSAADSVSPAIQRTREFLFRPFTWKTYLKLCLVGMITEGFSFRSSHGGGRQPSGRGPIMSPPFSFTPLHIAMTVAAVLLMIVAAAFVFYLVTRLRFAFFHCLIRKTREIRPGWHLYREPATRFFWLNVVAGLCFVLLAALLSIPFVAGFWRLIHEYQSGGHPDIALLVSLILPLIPVVFLLLVIGILADVVLRDWMLPHYALQNASAGEAWREVWTGIRGEMRQFLVYALLRVVLPTIAMIAVFMVLLIPGLILAGSIGAIIYAVHVAFAGSTGGSAIAGTLLQAFFGVVGFLFMLLAAICLGGPLSTGTREYALTFYGGRYRVLGDVLDRPAAPGELA